MQVLKLLIVFAFFISAFTVKCIAQGKDWQKISESVFPDKKHYGSVAVRHIITDYDGNVIVCGNFNIGSSFGGTVLDGSSSTGLNNSAGNTYGFIIKYNAEGDLLWLKKTQKADLSIFSSDTYIYNIQVDKQNNIYVWLNLSNAFFKEYPIKPYWGCIMKLDKIGKIAFMKEIMPNNFYGVDYSFNIDEKQNINVTQIFQKNNVIDIAGVKRTVSTTYLNAISKYDSAFNLLKFTILDSGDYRLYDNYYNNNNLTTTKHFYYLAIKGNSGAGAEYSLRKYDLDGKLLSEKFLPVNYLGFDYLNALNIQVDDSENVYITMFDYAKFLNNQIYKYALVKFDSTFNEVWHYTFPETKNTTGFSYDANISPTGNITTRIRYQDSLDLGSGFKVYSPSNKFINKIWGPQTDYAYAKFTNTGKLYKIIRVSSIGINYDYFRNYADGKCGEYYIAEAFVDSLYLGDDIFLRGNKASISDTVSRTFRSILKKYSATDTTSYITFDKNAYSCDTVKLIPRFHSSFTKIYWLTNGEVLDSNKTEFLFSAGKSGKYPITILGIKANGCQNTFTDTILYIKRPEAKFLHKDTVGCQWLGYQFINQSTSDTVKSGMRESFTWFFGDGTSDTAKNPLHIYTKSGKFIVTLIYSNGFCNSIITQDQSVEILPAPKPGFTVNDTIGCAPFTVNVKDNSQGAVAKYTYAFGKEFTSNDANPTYTFTKPGIYWVSQKLLGSTDCITSDSVQIRIRSGILPKEKPGMLRATFVNNNAIEISWKKHPLAESYTLYKQFGKNTSATIQKHFSDTVYMDNAVSIVQPFHYYIKATDSCGNLSAQSLIAKPIILQGENIENKYILLRGTGYEKWENGVTEYALEMKDANDNFVPVNNSTQTNYTDSLRDIDHLLQQCYRLKAIEKDGNKQVSYSNVVCIDHLPQLFIPDAFSPNNDSLNEQFTIYTIGIREYTISIYNRWGELVYTGDKNSAFWNGKFKNTLCEDGNYLYTLQARSRSGENIRRTGYIKLLK